MRNIAKKLLLVLIILLLPAYNFIRLVSVDATVAVSLTDKSFVEILGKGDIREIERRIGALFEERRAYYEQLRLEEERKQNIEKLLKEIADGTVSYRRLYSDTLIVGDSLMNGLEIYNVLDKANMISMVSASLYHLQDNYSKIISNNPKKLVLHYGINMMTNSQSQLDFFISMYTGIINRLKSDIPDTEIYISGIFNVSSSAVSSYPCVEKYNDALSEMCEALEVNFVDNSECLPGDESYYGSDGIHVSKAFYVDVWLPHLYIAMNS